VTLVEKHVTKTGLVSTLLDLVANEEFLLYLALTGLPTQSHVGSNF
jgi:hypothetical protein